MVQIQPPQPNKPRRYVIYGAFLFIKITQSTASYPYRTLTQFKVLSEQNSLVKTIENLKESWHNIVNNTLH